MVGLDSQTLNSFSYVAEWGQMRLDLCRERRKGYLCGGQLIQQNLNKLTVPSVF